MEIKNMIQIILCVTLILSSGIKSIIHNNFKNLNHSPIFFILGTNTHLIQFHYEIFLNWVK